MPINVHFNFIPNSRKPARRTLIDVSNGDNPVIPQPIRAVSVDTAEKANYAGGRTWPKANLRPAGRASKMASSQPSPRPCAPI